MVRMIGAAVSAWLVSSETHLAPLQQEGRIGDYQEASTVVPRPDGTPVRSRVAGEV